MRCALKSTHTRECNAAVTTLGCGRVLLDVVVDELAARGLHHPTLVGGGIVRVPLAKSDALGHVGRRSGRSNRSSKTILVVVHRDVENAPHLDGRRRPQGTRGEESERA
jgi:hypothetical protein